VSRLVSFFRFLWEFVVGDDWRIAAGVVVALGITAAVATTDVAAWWILPVIVLMLLVGSVWRVATSRG
jgi:hypothetical protein